MHTFLRENIHIYCLKELLSSGLTMLLPRAKNLLTKSLRSNTGIPLLSCCPELSKSLPKLKTKCYSPWFLPRRGS